MPLPTPERRFNAFVGQRGHGKPRMGDAQTAFFLRKQCYCSFHSVPLGLGGSPRSCTLGAVRKDQLMNNPHNVIGRPIFPEKQVGLY
jgi:hypothetical protein